MTILAKAKRYAFYGMIAAALVAVASLPAMGKLGAPLPGSGCPTELFLIYDPPPFMGWVRGECNKSSGEVRVFGRLDQVGTDCFINFDKYPGGFQVAEGVDCDTLSNTVLMGFCITSPIGLIECGDPPVPVPEQPFLEIVGAGGLEFNEDGDEFTVKLVVMPLKPR